jgi:hypothetical protein
MEASMSRALLLLSGLWLGMLLSSWAMATINFGTVDRVLAEPRRPELERALASVSADDRRMVLRLLASEINRWMFRNFAWLQLALGALAVALAWNLGSGPRLIAIAILATVLVQAGLLAPRIAELGRTLDFVARPLPEDLARRFGVLHGAYVLVDFARAFLLIATAWLLRR